MAYRIIPILICLFFAVLAGLALLHPGLPPTHDGEYHVIRFYEFDKVLRSGVLYPRWAPDLNSGYGVPLFNFVYPLPNYFASVIHLLGFSFIDAFKANLFFATLTGAVFFYLWSSKYWGVYGGIVSSVFYTFSPYRFVDIYIRGSVGEVWALAFFPAFLWSFDASVNDKKYLPVSAVMLALMIFSHNILAIMFFAFGVVYMLLKVTEEKEKKRILLNSIFITVLGLALSAVFWLPALLEKQYVVGLQIFDVGRNFPELYQLLIPSWGSGFSGSGSQDEMSYQIGLANLVVVLLSGFILVALWKRRDKNFRIVLLFFVSFFFVVFLMLRIAQPVWDVVPLLVYFQFPWRLLSLVILFCSFLAGSIYYVRSKKVMLIFLIVIAVVSTYSYARPAFYHDRNDAYYVNRSNFIDGTNSPGNVFNTLWFDPVLRKTEDKVKSFDNRTLSIREDVISPQYYRFDIMSDHQGHTGINTAFFPGWQVFIDGTATAVHEEGGLIGFTLPSGTHVVEVRFTDTIIRRIAFLISACSVLLVCFLVIKEKLMVQQQ